MVLLRLKRIVGGVVYKADGHVYRFDLYDGRMIMDRLRGINVRIGTGYPEVRYLNIDEDGEEIGHIVLSWDGTITDVSAKDVRDKFWMEKIAEYCRVAFLAAERPS